MPSSNPLNSEQTSDEPILPAPPLPVFDSSLVGLDAANRTYLQEMPMENKAIEQALADKSLPIFWFVLIVILCTIMVVYHWVMPWIRAKIRAAFAPNPHDRAVRSLKKLDNLRLVKESDFTDFYSRSSFIVRRFLEEQFQLKVTALTTQEFLDELITQPIFKKEMQNRLQQFLQHADLVKFAHHTPSLDDCQQVRQSAQQLIEDCAMQSSKGRG